YRVRHREFSRSRPGIGQNPPSGVIVYYYLAQPPAQAVSLAFQDKSGKTIEEFSSASSTRGTVNRVRTDSGLNRFVWGMRYPDAMGIDGGTYFLGGTLQGPAVPPGHYTVKLTVDGESHTQNFEIR